MFRINGFDNITDSIEFYFKADREDERSLICNFCVADDGIYYYRKGSQILSPKENRNTRNTPHGFISMEDLGSLFEALRKAKLHDFENENEKHLKITRHGRKVIIEEADSEQ
ncbi:MAG: hypothetical protein B6D41_01990 [Chloroflexi bacterium UTCFX4]|jgi:hypothetical protein|nr:MAG: hypothetical protein B6D41_01990 [Chloroflexi bacterium UTCFX4]